MHCVYEIFVALSFATGTWLLLTWTLFSTKRKQRLVWVFIFDLWCLTLMNVVHVAQKPKHGHIAQIGCRNNSEFLDWSDGGWIIFYAIWFIFWQSKACWWWMLQALDIFLKVVIGFRPAAGSRRERQRDICYVVGGLIYAFTLTLVGLITHTYGAADGGVAWAQYHERDPNYPRIPWGTTYAPMIALTIVGSVCMTVTIVSLWRSTMKSGLHSRQRTIRQYARPIAFILLFLLFFIFVISYRGYNQAHESEWKQIVAEWAVCMLGPGGGSNKCGVVPPTSASAGMFYMIHVAIFGQFFLVFIMFGTAMINVKLWAYGIGTTLGISRLVRFGRDATEAGSATSRTTEKDGKSGKSKTKQSETMSQPASPRQASSTLEARSASGLGSSMRSASAKNIPNSSFPRGIETAGSTHGLLTQLKDDMAALNPTSSSSNLHHAMPTRPHHRNISSMGTGVSLGEVGVELGVVVPPTPIATDRRNSASGGQPHSQSTPATSTRNMSVQVGVMDSILPVPATGSSSVSSSALVTPASALGMNVPEEVVTSDTGRTHTHTNSSSGGNRTNKNWV